MRIIIFGTGAIGGAIAAALTHAGHEVTAIARGTQLAAIREGGLRLRSPNDDFTARFDVVESPEEARIGPDDAVLLAMKGQDTQPALEALRTVGVTDQPIFCLQNGVDNERKALRLFPNVHGVTVMMPATFTRPGEVVVSSVPQHGIFDIGLATGGHDAQDAALAELLQTGNFAAYVTDAVMASKYGKLLMNLNNIVEASIAETADAKKIFALCKAEGEAALTAAGIAWQDVGLSDPRRAKHLNITHVEGAPYEGSSTRQSLIRGTGSVETDFLNGEIVLLGRQYGVPVPANAVMSRIAARMAREGTAPASLDGAAVLREIEAG